MINKKILSYPDMIKQFFTCLLAGLKTCLRFEIFKQKKETDTEVYEAVELASF